MLPLAGPFELRFWCGSLQCCVGGGSGLLNSAQAELQELRTWCESQPWTLRGNPATLRRKGLCLWCLRGSMLQLGHTCQAGRQGSCLAGNIGMQQ